MSNNPYDVPTEKVTDKVHSLTKDSLGAIPLAGSIASELFNMVVSPPIEKRRNEWMESVGQGLLALEVKIENLEEKLSNDNRFIDIALQASVIALRTSQKEKLEALKNVILNIANGQTIDESLQIMFLSFIEGFTIWHIRLLDLFSNPKEWLSKHGKNVGEYMSGSKTIVLEVAYPELARERTLYDLVWKDLYAKGLVVNDSLHVMMTSTGIFEKATSTFGDKFLNFIKSPIE